MIPVIKDAVDRAFIWLDKQKPDDLKEISRFHLAYTMWDKEKQWINPLKENLQNIQGQNVRDVARALFSISTTGINPPNVVPWIEEQQNTDGSWGKQDVYDTTYALAALANVGIHNSSGCKWIIDNFSSEWEHPGTVSLIITSLLKQGKTANADIYNGFTSQRIQWLCDHEEAESGWKYIATTTIVIDALINAENPKVIHNAVEWLLKKQNPDGSWGKDKKAKNTTAMVLACFAGIQ